MRAQNIFRAIADPTRRDILGLLALRDMNVNEIASHFGMTRPAVAKHLRILREGELVAVREAGRERIQSLRAENLKTVADWVAVFGTFWDDKLDGLKQAVEAGDE